MKALRFLANLRYAVFGLMLAIIAIYAMEYSLELLLLVAASIVGFAIVVAVPPLLRKG